MIIPRRGSVPIQIERVRSEGAGDRDRVGGDRPGDRDRIGRGRPGARDPIRIAVRDRVTTEEPMEIRLEVPDGGETHQVAVTMRTPGDDFNLAAGFLHSEGFVHRKSDILTISYCTGPEEQEYNVVSVALRPGTPFDPALLNRNFYTTSSCGVCGKASLEAVEVSGCAPFSPGAGAHWSPQTLQGLPQLLGEAQDVFQRTGGIHAAALFRQGNTAEGDRGNEEGDPTVSARLELLREDVGRHNAVDKVVGHLLLEDGLPATDALLLVSGRSSFEILQKALAAGIPTVAAVGAPSSLAVELAREFGMTLVGFLGTEGFNIYTGGERIRG